MHIETDAADTYVQSFIDTTDVLLQQIEVFTQTNHAKAHMLSGTLQGNFLSILSKSMQPKFILEVGTFTGYSALCLAKGLAANGQLHTIELRQQDAATAQHFFNQSLYNKHITLHTGNAMDIIPTLPFKWDIVFIDADKTGYIDYYELILPQLQPNGLMIVDNVLFHGQVVAAELKGKNAIAIDAFNQHVKNDDRTTQVILTVRDGLMLINKK